MEQQLCSSCHFVLTDQYYFCPNCGKKVKEPPPSTSISKQITIYAISIFLPPFGLWPAFRYLQQDDPKKRMIGIIAIVLTVLSTIISIWLTVDFINQLNKAVGMQMQLYQNMGY